MGTTGRWTFVACTLLIVVLVSGVPTPQVTGSPAVPAVPAGPTSTEGPAGSATIPIDARCPCLFVGDCPRVYNASSSEDILHFGRLDDCKDALLVRCCGAQVEVRETVSVGLKNGSMEIVNMSLMSVLNETDFLTPENIEMPKENLNGTLEKSVDLKPEARDLSEEEMDFNIDDPVNIIPTNESASIRTPINETVSVLKSNATVKALGVVNATVENKSDEPEVASSELEIQQIAPANLSEETTMQPDLSPTDTPISPALNSTDAIVTDAPNVTENAETVKGFYPPATYDVSEINNITANGTIEDDGQISVTDVAVTELADEDDSTSTLSPTEIPLSEVGNNDGEARSLETVEFDNRSDNASVTQTTPVLDGNETGDAGDQTGNSTQLYPGIEEVDLGNDTMSIDGDKNDTVSMGEEEIEATMERMKQVPGIMYVFPMHNMRKKKANKAPFLVYPTINATDNETASETASESPAMVSKIAGDSVVNSDLESMASTAEGVSSTVKGKVIIRKFMPKVKLGHSRRSNSPRKASAVTVAPTTPKESEKSSVATNDHPPKSTTASPIATENNSTSPSIKFKQNLKYKINTRRLPSKFSIKPRANGKIDTNKENNSSLLTQGPVGNRSLSQADKEIDINAPIRSKSIMIKRIVLKSKAGVSTTTSTPTTTLGSDDSRLEASGSEHREDVLLPEGDADANRRAIPSRDDVAHPSRATSKGALASRRRRPVATTTEAAQVGDATPATQTMRPRSSPFRRRPVTVADIVSTTTPEPKKLGSILVNIRINPIIGAADGNVTTDAPQVADVNSLATVETVAVSTETPTESLNLNESVSTVASLVGSDEMKTITTSSPLTVPPTASFPEVHDQIENVTINEMKSPAVKSHSVPVSKNGSPELIVEKMQEQKSSLVEQSPTTKARVSYTRTTTPTPTPAPPSSPTLKSGIKFSSRQKENRKVVENKGDVTPKPRASFPRRGSVRYGHPTPKFDSEVAQESQLVGVLQSSEPDNKTVGKTVDLKTNKTETEEVHSMKIILPANHNSEIPIKIMLSNTEEDGVIEIMMPKMEPKIPPQIVSQVRPTRSSNNGFHSGKSVEKGVFTNPGFFSIVGPIPKGFSDTSLINQDTYKSPVLELPKLHNFKKFKENPVKRFLQPVIDAEKLKKQHNLFLLKQINDKIKNKF